MTLRKTYIFINQLLIYVAGSNIDTRGIRKSCKRDQRLISDTSSEGQRIEVDRNEIGEQNE